MVSVQVLQQSQLHKFHFDFLRLCGLQFCECASFTAVRKFHRRVAHLSSLRACLPVTLFYLSTEDFSHLQDPLDLLHWSDKVVWNKISQSLASTTNNMDGFERFSNKGNQATYCVPLPGRGVSVCLLHVVLSSSVCNGSIMMQRSSICGTNKMIQWEWYLCLLIFSASTG